MTKTFLVAFSGLLFLLLQGCGGVANYSGTPQKHPYDVANENMDACDRLIDRSSRPEGLEEKLLTDTKDPKRLAKITSTVPMDQAYKDYMLVFESQYVRCSNNYLSDLSRIDSRLVANWADMMTDRTEVLAELLEGKFETYGDLNKRIDVLMSRFEQRRQQVFDALNREIQQANAQAEAQRQQQAQIAWQNYQNSLIQSNQVMNNYLNNLNRQREYRELNRQRQTNCIFNGMHLNCTTY